MFINIFDILTKSLPNGWIAELNKTNSTIEILGPEDARIFIKLNANNRTPVVGSWPNSSCGQKMDPYQWGVLGLNENYPNAQLNALNTTKENIAKIVNYIADYKLIYSRCLKQAFIRNKTLGRYNRRLHNRRVEDCS